MRSDMEWTMARGDSSGTLEYDLINCRGTALVWRRGDQVRVPSAAVRRFTRGLPFRAAGRPYLNLKQLAARQAESDSDWYLDCYGRKVLHIAERFPCFDSYDALYETRFYRWFFLCEHGRLTRIYAADTKPSIYVTEDVALLEDKAWAQMEKLGCLDRW